MTASNPTIREDLNAANPVRIADLWRMLHAGDFIAALIQQLGLGGRVQAAQFTPAGATETKTFAQLGMTPPGSTNYSVFASSATTTARVAAGTKTTSQFGLANLTATEPTDVIVVENTPGWAQQLAVSGDAAVLSPVPDIIFDVFVTAGSGVGRKALLKGGVELTPGAGQVVWDGGHGLRFAPGEASAVRVVFLPKVSPPTTSLLDRTMEQRDGGR